MFHPVTLLQHEKGWQRPEKWGEEGFLVWRWQGRHKREESHYSPASPWGKDAHKLMMQPWLLSKTSSFSPEKLRSWTVIFKDQKWHKVLGILQFILQWRTLPSLPPLLNPMHLYWPDTPAFSCFLSLPFDGHQSESKREKQCRRLISLDFHFPGWKHRDLFHPQVTVPNTCPVLHTLLAEF